MSTSPSECPAQYRDVIETVQLAVPMVLGTILNWTLYGILITQLYVYAHNFPDDGRRFKCLAYGVVFLETVQSCLAIGDLFHFFHLIGRVDQIYALASPLSPWVGPILVGGVAAVVVQFFYAYRIWVLGNKKSKWLCLTILFLSAVSGISEITGSILLQLTGGDFPMTVFWTFGMIWLVGTVLTDGIITTSMFYFLKRECSEGTSTFSKNAVSKIVRLSVETNLLTTAVAIMAFVSYTVTFTGGNMTATSWSYCPLAVIGKLYANALFASLNNRIAIREGPARNHAAARIPDATLSKGKPSNDSGCMHCQLDRPPSVMIFTPLREGDRGSRESGGDESLVIDIA